MVSKRLGEADGSKKVTKPKSQTITVHYENPVPKGVLERSLAEILAKKIRNGSLKIQ
jgi:hypothetical protein